MGILGMGLLRVVESGGRGSQGGNRSILYDEAMAL